MQETRSQDGVFRHQRDGVTQVHRQNVVQVLGIFEGVDSSSRHQSEAIAASERNRVMVASCWTACLRAALRTQG